MKLLVVDDEEPVRNLCRRILAAAGYALAAAASGEEAAQRLGEDFDIVLTDLGLPGAIDGNELVRRVREAGSADAIILTGNPHLETAIQAMRDGAYDYLIKPFTQDTLLNAVNRCAAKRRLSKELAREKLLRQELDAAYRRLARMEKLRETLGQFATPEVAQYTLDHPDDFWRRGERRQVTMLFADVRSFTAFAARLPPEEVVSALNEVFGLAIEAVRREGGILNKFIGDGMMALFGAPVPLADQAGAAARAARAALREVEALGGRRQARGQEGLRLGVGIDTGEVVAGCLGTRERTEYSVIGHAVNLAARLEESARPGEILVGSGTAVLLRGRFPLLGPTPVQLAGFEGPVAAYQLPAEGSVHAAA